MRRIEGIVGRGVVLSGVHAIVRGNSGWIKDVGVAFVFLRELGLRKGRSSEEKANEEPDHPHGEPLTSETTNGFSLLPSGDQRKHRQALPVIEHVLAILSSAFSS